MVTAEVACDLGGIFSLYNEEDVCTAYEFNIQQVGV
jgi:hypothetical protein